MRRGLRKWFMAVVATGLAVALAWGSLGSTAGIGQAAVPGPVDASSKGLLVVFQSGRIPPAIEDALSARGGVKVTPLPDIGAVAIRTPQPEDRDAVQRMLTERFGADIEALGADPTLTLNTEQNRPVGETLPLQAVNLETLKADGGVRVDPGPGLKPQGVPAASGDPTPATTASSVDVDRAVLYRQWGWDIQQVTENGRSFAIQPGSHRVKVAVIDSGIDANHPDLKSNIVSSGRSFVPGDPSTADDFGHGTMVAGVIAANGLLLGVGPRLGIVPYRVFQHGDAESSWVIQAIIQAVKDKVDVINLSLGTYKSLKNPADRAALLAYQRAIAYALAHGVTVVASSGTNGVNIGDPAQLARQLGHPGDLQIHAPGGLPGVLTVAGTNRQGVRAYYSNYGWNVDIAAPSGDFGPLWESQHIADVRDMCLVTYPTNLPQTPLSQMAGFPKGYEWMIGTSLAAPKVAAAAALVLAEQKEKRGGGGFSSWAGPLNPLATGNLLRKTAVDVGPPGRDPDTGAGVVDVAKALDAVR